MKLSPRTHHPQKKQMEILWFWRNTGAKTTRFFFCFFFITNILFIRVTFEHRRDKSVNFSAREHGCETQMVSQQSICFKLYLVSKSCSQMLPLNDSLMCFMFFFVFQGFEAWKYPAGWSWYVPAFYYCSAPNRSGLICGHTSWLENVFWILFVIFDAQDMWTIC